MDYFSMQAYLQELMEAGLILLVSREEAQYYTLHPDGEKLVELFRLEFPIVYGKISEPMPKFMYGRFSSGRSGCQN